MSETLVCPYSRQKAAQLHANGVDIGELEIPHQLPTPDSDEALILETRIKPYYYALAAPVVSNVIDTAMESPVPAKAKGHYPWIRAMNDFNKHMETSTEKVYKTLGCSPEIIALEGLHRIRTQLQPGKPKTLQAHLYGGAENATTMALLNLLRLSPALSAAPDDRRENALRKSYNLLIDQASTNMRQLFMQRVLLEQNKAPATSYEADSNRLRYTSPPIDGRMDDYMHVVYESIYKRRVQALTIRDIRTFTPVIGCPILLTRDVPRFWNWIIDQAIERELV